MLLRIRPEAVGVVASKEQQDIDDIFGSLVEGLQEDPKIEEAPKMLMLMFGVLLMEGLTLKVYLSRGMPEMLLLGIFMLLVIALLMTPFGFKRGMERISAGGFSLAYLYLA